MAFTVRHTFANWPATSASGSMVDDAGGAVAGVTFAFAGEATRSLSVVATVPDEGIAPGNNNIIGPSIYGAKTYGDFMVARQTNARETSRATVTAGKRVAKTA